MSFAEELRSRLKTKQTEWEKCKEELREVKERESRLRDELSAIQVLLNAEKPKHSKGQENFAGLPLPITKATESNKAEAVRELINELGPNGVTPAQLREIFAERQMEMTGNYLYAILLRAKKTGQVQERNGKYYPAEKEKVAG